MVLIPLTRVHGTDQEALAAVGSLRLQAWGPIIGPEAARLRFGIDEHDATAWHCVIVDGVTAIAAGRLTAHFDLRGLPESTSFDPYREQMRLPLGLASRLVVHPRHQGSGHAERIIADRLALASDLGVVEVWGETRADQMAGFARHGYEPMGPSADRTVPGDWVVLRAAIRSGPSDRAPRRSAPDRRAG